MLAAPIEPINSKRSDDVTPVNGACSAVAIAVISLAGSVSSRPLPRIDQSDTKPKVITNFTPTESGEFNVQCACVLATSGCSLELLWKAGGAQLHEWSQDASLVAGKSTDISAACYRKRDVDKLGAGLCCEVSKNATGTPDTKELHALFAALKIQKN
jgi:hypothetical protein